jgi:hypothetical protein
MADSTGQILGSSHPIDLAPYRGFALRQSAQVYKISAVLANKLQISVIDAELSSILGRKWSWSRGMIYKSLHQLSSSYVLHPGQPRLASEDLEVELVRFYFTRRHDKAPITVSDTIDLFAVQNVNVDRFWVRNCDKSFVVLAAETDSDQFCFQALENQSRPVGVQGM